MSVRKPHRTDDAPGVSDGAARRSRFGSARSLIRAASARSVLMALGAAIVLVAVVTLAVPDRDAVNKAAAKTRRVDLRQSLQGAGHLQVDPPLELPSDLPLASITVGSSTQGIAVPRSFLGLSTESWALPRYEQHPALFEKVLSLVHVAGDGPLVLRIGGNSADHTYWRPTRRLPRRSFVLTPGWLQQVGSLVRQTGLRVIMDLNLVANSPSMAAGWAKAAEAAFPPKSILGFEVGNEPDYYSSWHRPRWELRMDGALPLPDYSVDDYVRGFTSYARALEAAIPGATVAGPVVANPQDDSSWLSTLIGDDPNLLGLVTAHRYPLSACVPRAWSIYPTVKRLLSEGASAGMARSVADAVVLAHSAGLRFRLTELNSVTCGGLWGVSNTFATALWAPDALFELLRTGVDGVNMHIRADAINAPVWITGRGLWARPLMYGLIMFARTAGPHGTLVPARVVQNRSLHLKVWAVRVAGNRLHVLILDKGRQSAAVHLHLPATGTATVQRLLAPSIRSHSDVTLAGERLGPDASWEGAPVEQQVVPTARGYEVTVPGMSAALLSVPVNPGARLHRAHRGGPGSFPRARGLGRTFVGHRAGQGHPSRA